VHYAELAKWLRQCHDVTKHLNAHIGDCPN
jgi:hypothetical protein